MQFPTLFSEDLYCAHVCRSQNYSGFKTDGISKIVSRTIWVAASKMQQFTRGACPQPLPFLPRRPPLKKKEKNANACSAQASSVTWLRHWVSVTALISLCPHLSLMLKSLVSPSKTTQGCCLSCRHETEHSYHIIHRSSVLYLLFLCWTLCLHIPWQLHLTFLLLTSVNPLRLHLPLCTVHCIFRIHGPKWDPDFNSNF